MNYAFAFLVAFMLSFSMHEIAEAFGGAVGVGIRVLAIPAAALTAWLVVSTL